MPVVAVPACRTSIAGPTAPSPRSHVSIVVPERLRIKLFQDGAELKAMVAAREQGIVAGFTTNPTLMRKAGVRD